ncbi:hypothetical protein D3C87_1267210 [compost metagenome]
MKTMSLVLMALVAGLVACSEDSGSGNKPNGPTNFEPARKPANAVSAADQKYYQQLIVTATQHLPKDEVIFSTVLSGSKAESVKQEDRDKAIALLNEDGKNIARLIQDRCQINQAQSTTTGDTEMRVGAKQREVGTMSITDESSCLIPMSRNAQSDSVITSIDGNSKLVHIKSTTTMVDSTSRKVNDDYVQYRTNLRSTATNVVSKANLDVAFSQDKITMKAVVKGNGTMAYELMDGDYVRGPVTFEASIDSGANKANGQFLYDLQTSRGALRIVMIGTESGQEVYVNGEKVNPGDFGPLGTELQLSKSNVSALQAMAKKLLQ